MGRRDKRVLDQSAGSSTPAVDFETIRCTQATQRTAKHSILALQAQGRRLPQGLFTSTHHKVRVDHDESKGAQDCDRPV